jgi:hypothetical protein
MDRPTGHSKGGRDRGQSELIGVILVFGLMIVGAVVVVALGASAIGDSQDRLSEQRAEKAMTQFDSRAAQVALGQSGMQQVSFGSTLGNQMTVDNDTGRVKITIDNGTGERVLLNESLGSVTSEIEDTSIAYQGGGVWRHQDGDSLMVAPPEYHYRDRTLTFPVVRVSNPSWTDRSERVTIQNEGRTRIYPDDTNRNPLADGTVQVTITSDYHEGWKSFFEQRAEGSVRHYPDNRTVTVDLEVPFRETFDHAVVATGGDGAIDSGSTSPHGGFDSPTLENTSRPSASTKIDSRINDCASGACADLSSELGDDTLENGTYYADSDQTIAGATYDTTDGDIDVVVDGDLDFDGSDHTITGSGMVSFYLKGDMHVSGNTNVNSGGDPEDLLVMIHSNGGDVATASGTPQFTGLIYAPNSNLTINGGGNPSNDNIYGAAVVQNATANGNGNLHFDPSISYTTEEFASTNQITYLHITENQIRVSR